MLLLLGLGSVIGNAIAGHTVDRYGARPTVLASGSVMALGLAGVSLLGELQLATVAAFAVFGTATGVFVPAQQTRLVALAPKGPDFALALNLAALNLGISVGAALGSAIVDRGGLAIVGYASAAVAALAVGLTAGTTARYELLTSSCTVPRVLFGSMMGWRQALGDRLRAQGCEIVDVDGGDREKLKAALADVDIMLCSPQQGYVFDAELVAAAPRLRAVNSLVIGIETIDVEACTAAGVLVANGAIEENFLGVAEATVMLILALGLDFRAKERAMRATGTRPGSTRAVLLRERTVGLIGLGGLVERSPSVCGYSMRGSSVATRSSPCRPRASRSSRRTNC